MDVSISTRLLMHATRFLWTLKLILPFVVRSNKPFLDACWRALPYGPRGLPPTLRCIALFSENTFALAT